MRQIGQKIQEAREEKGLTLEELSLRSRIAKKQLQALEKGDFTVFAGEVYLKGAIRVVAAEIGLDPQPLLDLYSSLGREADNENRPDIRAARQKTGEHESKKFPAVKKRLHPGDLLIIILSIILLAGLYWAYTEYWPKERPEVLPPVQQDENGPEIPPETEEEPEAPPPPPAEAVRVERDAGSPGVVYIVHNADMLEIDLTFAGRCWIEARADGQIVRSGEFTANQAEKITADREINLRIGAPRNLRLRVNGVDTALPDTAFAFTMTIRLIQ